ncbi:RAS guanyl-releasing protein 2-B-like [Corticium candelabrum]|uniref:RAS guanyl-releasing protein 2-B-like n=1 Tax=Corticium candelabrum TaxID=121492 RepID=UPI002E270380|nr:RAS guanyl-releasing protein 2-B-like [Corticium candelabrum]
MSMSHNIDTPDVEYDGEELKSARIETLARLVVSEFEEGAGPPRLAPMLFVTHKWYVDSTRLADIFIDLYAKLDANGEEKQRRPAVAAIAFWAREYPRHFENNEKLVGLLCDFVARVKREGGAAAAEMMKPFLDVLLSSGKERRHHVFLTVQSCPSDVNPERRVSYSFNSVSAKSIAEHLTSLDHEAFSQIPFEEWASYGRSGKPFDCPKIQEAVVLFNGISCWVQSKVLSELTPALRAKAIVKYIDVAQHLLSLHNYNGLIAIVGGLNSSPISRLRHTFEALSSKAQSALNDLTAAVSSDSNYSSYRKGLEAATSQGGFVMPVIGVCLKDLISVHVALKDETADGLINMRKLTQLYQIFSGEIEQFQEMKPPSSSNKELLDILRISIQPRFTPDELYEVSLTREARNRSVSEDSDGVLLSPARSPLFGDWTAGIDVNVTEETLKKYINAMVKAVFRNYDSDKNGYISMEEFDDFSSNFPFLDSFAVLDTNSDGRISPEELFDYFFQANLPMMRRSFNHFFTETTYFSPTFCYHCKGLLWGLIKQGYKCKNCGVNCHRHCRDVVVAECRRESVLNSTPTLKRKIVARKKSTSSNNSKKQMRNSVSNGDCNGKQQYNKLEDAHSVVVAENSRLKSQLKDSQNALAEAQHQIESLKQEMATIRQGTIDYVLNHMAQFSKTKSTEV